jgi:hypothetical protein
MTNLGHGIKSPTRRPTIKSACGCECGCQGQAVTAYRLPEGAAIKCGSCNMGTHPGGQEV